MSLGIEPERLTLEDVFRDHVSALSSRDVPDGVATFEAQGAGAWTVTVKKGRATVARGRAARPTSIITSDTQTLIEVASGRFPGAAAFLERRLFLRGAISYALELDGHVQTSPRAPRARRVDVDGCPTFLLEAGPKDAPKVLLFHGLGATSASFLPTLWDLARDHHVIAPDLPGFGETHKPLRPLHAAFFARWAVDLMNALGVSRACAIGNSMGGRLALEVALRFPERLHKVALLAPSLAWRKYTAASPIVRLLRPELAVLPVPVLHRLVVRTLRSMFCQPARVADAAMNAAADEFLRAFSTARGRIAFFHAMREIYLEKSHFWDRLPTLSVPTLFLFGDTDWLVPPGFARHVMHAVPRAEVEVLESCGHVPQFEHPELTHARVRHFFATRHS